VEISSGSKFKEDLIEFFDDITPSGVWKLGWNKYIWGNINFDDYEFEKSEVIIDFVSSIHGTHWSPKKET